MVRQAALVLVAWTSLLVAGCAAGDDALGDLECAPDEVPRWNGSAWVCSRSDVLGGLACSADAVPKYNGSAWVCGVDDSTSLTGTYPLSINDNNNISIATAGITSEHIANSTIINEDVSQNANIAPDKIAGTAATLTGDQAFEGNTLVINPSNGRVGVGVNPPMSTLDVGGDIATAGDYTFATARMRALHLSAVSFTVAYPSHTIYDPVTMNTTGNYAYITEGTSTYYNYLLKDVHLPDGATIDSVTCRYYDASTTIDLSSDAYLYVRPLTSTSSTLLISLPMDTSGESSSVIREITGSPASTTVVDTSANSYFLRVYWYTGVNASSAARFYGCSVYYWISRL